MGSTPLGTAAGHGLALLVRLGGYLHALPVQPIEEVLPSLPIEPIAQCPPFVRGVVFVRGHLIPVLDGRTLLGLSGDERSAEPHIVCLRKGASLIGLEVDEAMDLIDCSGDEVMPAETLGAQASFLCGIIERDGKVIRLLDPARVVAADG